MPETQAVQIQCPNCGNAFQAPVRSVIDVGQHPELRQAFLSGQVNVAVCPKCRTGGALEVPLVYHDPAAEFLAVYFPPQLEVPEMEKQRMIGDLTQQLMRSLPPEQRKGYFLSPRTFMNRQNLMDGILGTMGITQEELDRQRKKMKMVDQLMVMADDPKGLEMMTKGQDAQLDYEFFSILASVLENAEAAGDEKRASRLKLLRESLMPITSWGKRAARQQAAVESLAEVKTADELLEKVLAFDAEEASAAAVVARPLMDYAFFQKLTERIDAAQGAERDRLTKVREQLVDVTQKLDEATREQIKSASETLQSIVSSPNPRSAVREHAAELSDMFMSLLSVNLDEAKRKGDKALFDRLGMVYDEIIRIMQEDMPPEVQLINMLLDADYPEGTRAMLQERREHITAEFLDAMEQVAQELAERGDENGTATAKRLRDIRSQAMLMV